ncbi:MAG TPA: hypothetical protein VML50_15835 [Anaeromyxobacter sp.]|nr:hypothetical protein [Anaeromyxobacter sp.]
MRLLLLVAAGLAFAGCSNPCQDLGNRFCSCVPLGTTVSSCEQQVTTDLGHNSPSHAYCSELLGTCTLPANAPAGSTFCEWIQTRCGKASCGMSTEPVTSPVSDVDPTCICDPACTCQGNTKVCPPTP